jgi:hypothetical protein
MVSIILFSGLLLFAFVCLLVREIQYRKEKKLKKS